MLALTKKWRKKGSTHFSSAKALKRSKMVRARRESERFQKDGITRTLDFEKTVNDTPLGGVEEDSFFALQKTSQASKHSGCGI